jgi:hypothetical protein
MMTIETVKPGDARYAAENSARLAKLNKSQLAIASDPLARLFGPAIGR